MANVMEQRKNLDLADKKWWALEDMQGGMRLGFRASYIIRRVNARSLIMGGGY